ncbi:L,D-transpeptidase [Microvirga massiliensis]|uniref:L,D-transpeptidase n=1 Tax=Microvirga massiliensis TaxID=1033741 RepID=UPI00062B5F2A|nr:L,D-transpeptidase [Microvirga massiliensis]
MRRDILAVVLVTSLGACTYKSVPDPQVSTRDAEWMAQVPSVEDDPLKARYLIDDPTGEEPGTIVVDTGERLLYYVLPNWKAVRYSVAVGNEAYGWTGLARVARKAEWPAWNPPAEMRVRWPHVRSMNGGPANPMGARALYLYQGDRDTLYRIHGTNEPEKIGQAVSSGCIRMRNIDVIDLYNRVDPNARVIVR